MFRDTHGAGGEGPPPRKAPEGMWSPEDEPHKSARMEARPMACNGECKDTCYGNGEGCTWCDYTPSQ